MGKSSYVNLPLNLFAGLMGSGVQSAAMTITVVIAEASESKFSSAAVAELKQHCEKERSFTRQICL
jgi:hypothetical protein